MFLKKGVEGELVGQGEPITGKMWEVILDAAQKLTGRKRWVFLARVVMEYCGGNGAGRWK